MTRLLLRQAQGECDEDTGYWNLLCDYARGIFANRTSSLPRHQFGYIRPGRSNRVLVMKNKPENHIRNFGQGAVYFGWHGTVVVLIAIPGTPSFVWGDVEKIGPALAVAMLTVLYGYMAIW